MNRTVPGRVTKLTPSTFVYLGRERNKEGWNYRIRPRCQSTRLLHNWPTATEVYATSVFCVHHILCIWEYDSYFICSNFYQVLRNTPPPPLVFPSKLALRAAYFLKGKLSRPRNINKSNNRIDIMTNQVMKCLLPVSTTVCVDPCSTSSSSDSARTSERIRPHPSYCHSWTETE